jgi:NitT/TauT family transport system substrate-binding protein
VRDLRGRTVAVAGPGRQAFVAAMASHVGLDPRKDIAFVVEPEASSSSSRGRSTPSWVSRRPQELRARKIGHVLVNTALDRPWSQYFCCFATANRTFVQKHPVATKRATPWPPSAFCGRS